MADSSTGDLFDTLTHGGIPNIRARRLYEDSWQLATLNGNEISATISYHVPADEVCFYYANFGIPHPECPDRFFLTDVNAKQIDCNRAKLTEIYKLSVNDTGGGTDPNEPPPNTYTIRSSEFSNPIQLNENFWDMGMKPGAPTEDPPGSGQYVCSDPGVLSDWAKGFISDKREGIIPDGMSYWTDGQERNAFPACHPKFGIESYLESGAEWTCTEYDISQPTQAKIDGISKLHTLQSPVGLFDAAANAPGKWLYTSYNSEFDGQWWNQTRSWRYSRTGWDPDIYGP